MQESVSDFTRIPKVHLQYAQHALLVALGTTPGLSQGQTQVVLGTNPSFLLILHSGRVAENVNVL